MNADTRLPGWLSISIFISALLMFSTALAQPGDGSGEAATEGSGETVVEGSGETVVEGSGETVVEGSGGAEGSGAALAVPASYGDACGRCHNDDGSPTRVGERLGSADLSHVDSAALTSDEILAAILEGREGMPPAELDEADLAEIVTFVDGLTP